MNRKVTALIHMSAHCFKSTDVTAEWDLLWRPVHAWVLPHKQFDRCAGTNRGTVKARIRTDTKGLRKNTLCTLTQMWIWTQWLWWSAADTPGSNTPKKDKNKKIHTLYSYTIQKLLYRPSLCPTSLLTYDTNFTIEALGRLELVNSKVAANQESNQWNQIGGAALTSSDLQTLQLLKRHTAEQPLAPRGFQMHEKCS